MAYTNEEISWDLTQLRRFYTNYVVKWLNSAMSWTAAQVARARANVGGIVDVSVLNAVGGTAQPYASLAAALADVPATYKRGGVEIQYIDSTTSKYVSFRLTKTSWSTTERDWQGVDDEPIAGSSNLVKSSGIKTYVDDHVSVLQNTSTEEVSISVGNAPTVIVPNKYNTDSIQELTKLICSGLLFEQGYYNSDGTLDNSAPAYTLRSRVILKFTAFPATLTSVRNNSGKSILFGYCLYDDDLDFIRLSEGQSALNLYILQSYGFGGVRLVAKCSEPITPDDIAKCVFSTSNTTAVNYQDSINERLLRIEGKRISLDIENVASTTFDYLGNRESVSKQSKTIHIKANTIYKITASAFEDCIFVFCKDFSHTSDYMKSKGLIESGTTVTLKSPEDGAYLYIEGTRFSDVVIIEHETILDKGYDNYNVKGKIAHSINRSLAYALNVAVPTMFPGYDNISELNGSGEYETRPWASLVFDLSFAIVNGIYDEKIIGHTLYEAKIQLNRFVKVLVNWHRANAGSVAYAWGNSSSSLGEGALIAYYIATAVKIKEDWFDSTTISKTRTMIEYEADNIVNTLSSSPSKFYWKYNDGTPVGQEGNSPAEEVAWCNAAVGAAMILTNSSTKYADYASTFCALSVIQNSMPNDYQSGKTVNGYDTANLIGYNLTEDGSVINHGITHPGYALSYCCSYMGAIAAMIILKQRIPQAALWNMDKISDCLTQRDYTQAEGYVAPYGTIYKAGTWDIYYPQGNDWGIVLGLTQAAFDSIVAVLGVHPDESWFTWANLHASLVLFYQNRFKGGNYYEPDGSENSLGLYTAEYISTHTFRVTPVEGTTSFENELYEPTKWLIAYTLLNHYPKLTTGTLV